MLKSIYLLIMLCCFTPLVCSGCSVGMAMSGKNTPNLGAVRIGATRGEVELHLGSPVQILASDGKRIDIYEYEIGNEPSAGRAIGHGVMDVLTLGLWEIVGTPVEAVQGDKHRMQVEYDEKNVVVAVSGSVPLSK